MRGYIKQQQAMASFHLKSSHTTVEKSFMGNDAKLIEWIVLPISWSSISAFPNIIKGRRNHGACHAIHVVQNQEG